MKIIKLENVGKKYKEMNVLTNINYIFEEGKTYLLLGHNGSGKSTLIKAILNFIKYSGNIKNDFNTIGYVPEKIIFPSYISIYDFLLNLGVIRKVKNLDSESIIEFYLKYFEIYKYRFKNLNHLSKGMFQKVLIIQALIHNPDLFIFDEALNGLDYQMQEKFLDLIRKLKDNKKTIIITTHYYKYYEDIYDKLIVLEQGVINERPC